MVFLKKTYCFKCCHNHLTHVIRTARNINRQIAFSRTSDFDMLTYSVIGSLCPFVDLSDIFIWVGMRLIVRAVQVVDLYLHTVTFILWINRFWSLKYHAGIWERTWCQYESGCVDLGIMFENNHARTCLNYVSLFARDDNNSMILLIFKCIHIEIIVFMVGAIPDPEVALGALLMELTSLLVMTYCW